jgi:Na+/melibiose symporter-like transporter
VDAKPKGVPLRNIITFAAPGLAMGPLGIVLGVYLPPFYAGLGLALMAIGPTVGAVRLIDMWLDPILAVLIDRTKTFMGRYRPWMIAGACLVMLGAYQLLFVAGSKEAKDLTLHLMIWMLVLSAGTSMINLCSASWVANLSTGYHDRARVYGLMAPFSVFGTVTLLLMPVLTHGKIVAGNPHSMMVLAPILVVAIPIAMFVCLTFTPERLRQVSATAPRPKFSLKEYWSAVSRPNMRRLIIADLFMTLGPGATGPTYVFFFRDVKHFTMAGTSLLLIFYVGSGIVSGPFWGTLGRKIGKHRAAQVGGVAYAVAQSSLMAIPAMGLGYTATEAIPTAIGMFFAGFCASAFLPLVRAMVADVVDEVRLESGQDLTSLMYSMVTTTTKVASAFNITLAYGILAYFGYSGKPGFHNTPRGIVGLELVYLITPIALVWLGCAMFFGYKLDAKRHAEISKALAVRDGMIVDVAAAEEALVGPEGPEEAEAAG